MKPLAAKKEEKKKKCSIISSHKNVSINCDNAVTKVLPEPKIEKSKNSIASIFDLSVLKMPVMILLSIANVFGMTGYYIPYVYIAGYAEESIFGKWNILKKPDKHYDFLF